LMAVGKREGMFRGVKVKKNLNAEEKGAQKSSEGDKEAVCRSVEGNGKKRALA